jgi:4a-hydroxytetrahydrobiopterin dehydratase
MDRAALLKASCRHREQAASDAEIAAALHVLTDWMVENAKLARTFRFRDYHQTLAFVNTIADTIHREDHHPELVVSYNRCIVRYDTHSVNGGTGGLSENDFICAAKIDDVFSRTFPAA